MSDIIDLMRATVRLEQPQSTGGAITATGFIVAASGADGSPRVILVTAKHVFARMPRDQVSVGFRAWTPEHEWKYAPINVRIRDAEGKPAWTKHPTQDVAAIELPAGVPANGLPISELPGERALEKAGVQPGDEMMVLGYPRGLSANDAGFPILRSGKVASYPLSPADRYPTYLVDFDVYAGNSGGPVYMPIRGAYRGPLKIVVTGLLTQQIKYHEQRLAIGNVTQADFISETVALMKGIEPVEISATTGVADTTEAAPVPVSASPSALDKLREAWETFEEDFRILLHRTWIFVRDWTLAILTPDARRL